MMAPADDFSPLWEDSSQHVMAAPSHTHFMEKRAQLWEAQAWVFLFSSGPKAISSNKMSLGSATAWPSNHTWLWLHLLMGEKWVFYTTAISAGVDRAKTLNPLFNLLDQFSSTYAPLCKCRIITGYSHFILIFPHKKKREIIDESRLWPLCPFNRWAVMTQSARFTEAALTSRLNFSKHLIVYQQLASRHGGYPERACVQGLA